MVRFNLALDSGAHSIYKQFISAQTGNTVTRRRQGEGEVLRKAPPFLSGENWSVRSHFLKRTDEDHTHRKSFRDYLEGYVRYVRANKDLFDFCVSLDIIYNPKRSYEMWIELEKAGIRTLPVLHYGEDASWLKKYMDHTDYIGIGGLGQGIASKAAYSIWARNVFALLSDGKGRPKWKTHGFAMTSTELLRKFPWTSVDSSSVFYHSRMGNVVVPRMGPRGSRDYLRELSAVAVTSRRRADRCSYLNMLPLRRTYVVEYLEELGFGTMEELGASHVGRDASNVVTFYRVIDAISKEREAKCGPLKFYVSGKLGTGHSDLFMETVPRIGALGVSDFNYMGTHFLPQSTQYLLAKGLCKGNSYANGKTIVRAEARPTLRRRN